LRGTAHFWALVVVWLAVHPTLRARLLSGPHSTPELEHRPPPLLILAKTLLATLNLDMIPRPQEVDWGSALRILASVGVLAAGAVVSGRSPPVGHPGVPAERKEALARFALVWMAAGWLPLFLPSIGWHAYYGCLGALGAWLGIALWLESRPRLILAVITCLAILRGAQAST